MSSGPELYIYWKVPGDQLPQALSACRKLQTQLLAEIEGLHARMLQRSQLGIGGDGNASTETCANSTADITVMEIYSRNGGMQAEHQQAVEAKARAVFSAAGVLPAKRHVEIFQPPGRTDNGLTADGHDET